MSNEPRKTLQQALDAGPIERIEIELLPNKQFRWKLWSDGRMTYCASGQGVDSEITAMIKSTELITRGMMMGTPIHG